MKVVLASASPRRKQLLEEAGYNVVCAASGIDEIEDSSFAPHALALENASRKAQAISQRFSHDLVIAADTIVAMGKRLFGKPADIEDAARMLRELSGCTHQVITGVVVVPAGKPPISFAESSLVTFHALDEPAIHAYVHSINPLDKAGAYAAQDNNSHIIKSIVGSLTNVIGLPMERLSKILQQELRFSPNAQ